MVNAALCIHLVALAVVGALPFAFFQRGEHHARWWLTALPFFVCGGALVLGGLGVLDPWFADRGAAAWFAAPSMAGSLGAIALIGVTVRVHRVPLHLWHQDGDDPVEIVDRGPYRSIRHPFYAAFLLILASSAVSFPHPLTALVFGYGAWSLNATAAQEERRLLGSRFGDRYAAYLKRTTRFVPALRVSAS
jgi:protein-S-isoprenylcysteine O-methyltransferase Ste14